MAAGRIEAIGLGDKTGKPQYASQTKKNPWEENIGARINGFGSLNNLPSKFNSAFTVGKPGRNDSGAFVG